MGINVGLYRNDDTLGFVIGHFSGEMRPLYLSQGLPTLYADGAIVDGIGAATRFTLGLGLFPFDADLDGSADLLQANGHLEDEISIRHPGQLTAKPPSCLC